MKILALEFSSHQRSVAVACGSGHVREVIETSKDHTMQPFAMIQTALAQAHLIPADIQRIVVGLGPGSYTGIRAGIALAQGWQLAHPVELLGLSSADAIAAQAHADGLRGAITVMIDAQRGEFYLARWELSETHSQALEPLHIASAAGVQSRAELGECIVGPDVTRWFPSGRIISPRAAMLAKLASHRAPATGADSLEPIYLRAPTFVKAPTPRVV